MEQRLAIQVDGERRTAIADVGLVGASQPGDELVVNVEAVELGLGSGGFDIVHVNLTRGLDGEGTPRAHVMKLNYTSLQHAVAPSRRATPTRRPTRRSCRSAGRSPSSRCTASSRRWPGRSRRRGPDARLGYVQTAGGALPGGHSCVVRELRDGGLLAGHLTAGPGVRRRRRRGDHDRRRAAPRADGARLGRGRRRPRPGHPRLGLGARPRRPAGAGLRAHGARARLPDAARRRACPRPTCARATAA